MATTIKQYFTTRNSIIALFVVIGYIIFNEVRKANWRKRIYSQIEEIDNQIGAGRIDASTLVDLNQKKKALLKEYLKTV